MAPMWHLHPVPSPHDQSKMFLIRPGTSTESVLFLPLLLILTSSKTGMHGTYSLTHSTTVQPTADRRSLPLLL